MSDFIDWLETSGGQCEVTSLEDASEQCDFDYEGNCWRLCYHIEW